MLAWALAVTVAMQPPRAEAVDLPGELHGFVEAGTRPIAVEAADLDGDGRSDYILVLEKQKAAPSAPDIEDGERPLLVVTRQPDGSLKLARRNDKVVYCSTCGGMMGDPFVGLTVDGRTFTVTHYGGSAWRWSIEYTFGYSRRDRAWQLVSVASSSFHATDPDEAERRVERPPKDFGQIDLADFDPDDYRDVGPR